MSDSYIDQQYIECGFFDAIEISPGVYDRVYAADAMSNPYKRIISDGIFPSEANNDFKVIADVGLAVQVKAGQGMFWSKWFELTQAQTIEVPVNESDYDRIDSVIVQINTGLRLGRVGYRTGEPAADPVPPTLVNEGSIREWRIANVTVLSNVSAITNNYISDRRGIETPFCASLIQTLNTEQLFTQWNAIFNTYFQQKQAEFDSWFETLTDDLNVSMDMVEIVHTYDIAESTTTISISDYEGSNDIIFVMVNGIMLNPNEYTISVDNTTMTFTQTLNSGASVMIRIFKASAAPLSPEGVSF